VIGKIRNYIELKNRLRFLRLPRKRIEEIQFRKLKAIVEHAYTTVPYYHDLFKRHAFDPVDLKSPDDIKKIPVTSKEDLLALEKSRITSSLFPSRSLLEARSSGSTGEPFTFKIEKTYDISGNLDTLRAQMIHGYRLSDRVLRISGDYEDLQWLKSPINLLFLKSVSFSSFSRPGEIVDFYNRYRPDIMQGYVTSMYALALWLENKNIRLKHRPKFIVCSAETVHDYMREKVSDIFRTKVIDRYATIELGVVAIECPSGEGYHIFEDSVYPEIEEIGGRKYFIGTNLDSFATPFIRYHTHDICEPCADEDDLCSCGITTKKIGKIIGRDNDFIRTPGGVLLAPIDLIFLMRTCYPFVNKFRFVQEHERSVRLEIVLRESPDKKLFAELQDKFKDMAGGLALEIIAVEDIQKNESGKMRIISSAV
jgi:phenylacetate-CoA ligase